MKHLLALMLALGFTALTIACSNTGERSAMNTTNTTTANANSGNTSHSGNSTTGAADDVPAMVRAALADAQSITTQHKDISAAQVAEIEKETNTKIKDTDHHAYFGFSNTGGGTRKQTGAATMVEAGGKEFVIIYESRNGVPYIKELRAADVPPAFLDQFKGKGHHDEMQIGQDIKAQGLDEAIARAAADAIRQDTRIMQTLYGSAHAH